MVRTRWRCNIEAAICVNSATTVRSSERESGMRDMFAAFLWCLFFSTTRTALGSTTTLSEANSGSVWGSLPTPSALRSANAGNTSPSAAGVKAGHECTTAAILLQPDAFELRVPRLTWKPPRPPRPRRPMVGCYFRHRGPHVALKLDCTLTDSTIRSTLSLPLPLNTAFKRKTKRHSPQNPHHRPHVVAVAWRTKTSPDRFTRTCFYVFAVVVRWRNKFASLWLVVAVVVSAFVVLDGSCGGRNLVESFLSRTCGTCASLVGNVYGFNHLWGRYFIH